MFSLSHADDALNFDDYDIRVAAAELCQGDDSCPRQHTAPVGQHTPAALIFTPHAVDPAPLERRGMEGLIAFTAYQIGGHLGPRLGGRGARPTSLHSFSASVPGASGRARWS